MYTQSTPTRRVCIHNTKIGDADAYSTGDLLIPHPTLPSYWKIFGRADDQLMHNTGEKVRVHHCHFSISLTMGDLPATLKSRQTQAH